MGACASVPKVFKGENGAAPPPEPPKEAVGEVAEVKSNGEVKVEKKEEEKKVDENVIEKEEEKKVEEKEITEEKEDAKVDDDNENKHHSLGVLLKEVSNLN